MKRTKRRYIAVQLECESVPSDRELMDAVWGSVTRLFGEVGASQSGLALINFDIEHKLAVLRCLLASLPTVRAGLAAITSVAAHQAAVHVIAVSGTLKALSSSIE